MKLTIIAIILTICIAYVASTATKDSPAVQTTGKGSKGTSKSPPVTSKSSVTSKRSTPTKPSTTSAPSKVTSSSYNPSLSTSKTSSTAKPKTTTAGSSSVAPSMWMITLVSAVVYQYFKHQ